MQQHPVPQNIASFEFKIVGDLTLKQFLYLAAGFILAGVFYVSPLPGIIKWPAVLMTSIVGISLGLSSVGDRPLDQWLIYFIKAVYKPTQFVWKKSITIPEFLSPTIAQPTQIEKPRVKAEKRNEQKIKLEEFLRTIPATPRNDLDVKEESYVQNLDFSAGELFEQTEPNFLAPNINMPEQSELYQLYGLEAEREQAKEDIKKEEAANPLASNINFATEQVISWQSPDQKTTFMPAIGSIKVRKLHTLPPLIPEEKTTKEEKMDLTKELREKLKLPQFTKEEQPATTTPKNDTLKSGVKTFVPPKAKEQFISQPVLKDLLEDIMGGATPDELKTAYPELSTQTIESYYQNSRQKG